MKLKKHLTAFFLAVMAVPLSLMPSTASAYSDPDENGVLNLADAVVIVSYLAGHSAPSDLSVLDFTENGIISEADSIALQTYLLEH